MINYIQGNCEYIEKIVDVWNDEYSDNHFLKPMTIKEFTSKLEEISFFDWNNTLLALDDDKVVGYCIYYNLPSLINNPENGAIISQLIVKKEYRNKGIGSTLLNKVIDYFKSVGKTKVDVKFFLPACYPWYIPNTDKHDHPCAPGIRINSNEYFFFLHRGFSSYGFQDAFHANLEEYEFSDKIKEIIEINKKDGISIELYDKNKHYGLDEFYKELNIYDFEKVIRSNLELDNPYPFLVVSDKGRIVGWTGAMWNEESGRGHFDGIAILECYRNRGLGKALFSNLAYYNKNNGAKFMTFYTGLTNYARYIYMGAGFKIVQSFCFMQRKI